MIRVLLYFVVLALLAYGGMWLIEHPGHVTISWFGWVVDSYAALIAIVLLVAVIVGWEILKLVFGLPSMISFASRQRRREKGYAALSRGLVAVGSGDARSAIRASTQADRHLKNDPLAMMLRAQSAHLNGDEQGTQAAFAELARREDTRILGLRGLYAEASRRGDDEAARQFADAAHKASPLPWSSQAVLEQRASESDWERALQTVESALAARHIDKAVGERQRAVLETAIAQDKAMTAPDEALALARKAMARAPDLAPPIVIAAQILSRRGDIRKASKMIEKAWPRCRHPDIAAAYLDVRPGDSTTDRLARARTLMGIASVDPVGRMAVARAALANKDFASVRSAMEPLVAEGKRPSVRACMLMAELEEAEFGDHGQWREWLARASRAPLDPAWVSDGIVYDHWSPVSPTTGKLDTFRWQVPAERLGPAIEPASPKRSTGLPGGDAQPKMILEAPATEATGEPPVPPVVALAPPPSGPAAEIAAAIASASRGEPTGTPDSVTESSPAGEIEGHVADPSPVGETGAPVPEVGTEPVEGPEPLSPRERRFAGRGTFTSG